MVPTIEEAQNLEAYNGNINDLGSAEQFVKMIINVPFAFPRIEAMLYREMFEDEVAHLRKSFSVLEVMKAQIYCLISPHQMQLSSGNCLLFSGCMHRAAIK